VPPCLVDPDRSASFRALLNSLRKRFPHLVDDLAEIWPKIATDYRNACGAESIPTFNDTVFKYRCKSTDLRKGAANAFRVIAYLHATNNTLYPLFLYYKGDLANLGAKAIAGLVKEFVDSLDLS